jgi:hypothetical protein
MNSKKKKTFKDFQVKKNPQIGDIESPRPLYPNLLVFNFFF